MTKAAVSAELGFDEFLFTNGSLCETVEFWGEDKAHRSRVTRNSKQVFHPRSFQSIDV